MGKYYLTINQEITTITGAISYLLFYVCVCVNLFLLIPGNSGKLIVHVLLLQI